MSVVESINHLQTFPDRMPLQWHSRPVTKAYVDALASTIQDAENLLNESEEGMLLDNAIGVQLDVIGKLVGVDREGRSDDDYRSAIFIQSTINRATGSVESVIDVANIYTGRTDSTIFEHPDAFCLIYIHGSPDNEISELFDENVVSAGVNSAVIYDENNSLIPVESSLYPTIITTGEGDEINASAFGETFSLSISQENFNTNRGRVEDVAGNVVVDLQLSDGTNLELSTGENLEVTTFRSENILNILAEALLND